MKITEADIAVCEKSDTFLQSSMWGKFKSCFGWISRAFLLEIEGYKSSPFLVLTRSLTRFFSFIYIPWGPELPSGFTQEERENVLLEISKKIKPFLPLNCIFLRFEPPWFVQNNDKNFEIHGLKRAGVNIQAPDTVHLDLSLSNEDLLLQMKPKWRYNISLSEKKGVKVKCQSVNELEIFYNLLKQTAKRDGIAIHNFSYYKTLFELCSESECKMKLYIATHENDNLATIMVLFRGKYATYLYGASSDIKRNLMATYALQWEVIKDAKMQGCKYYDLFGIPPDDNPDHPMAGLYRFKTGFGGLIIKRPGTWDYPYKPVVYYFFKKAESLRKKTRDIKKKK